MPAVPKGENGPPAPLAPGLAAATDEVLLHHARRQHKGRAGKRDSACLPPDAGLSHKSPWPQSG